MLLFITLISFVNITLEQGRNDVKAHEELCTYYHREYSWTSQLQKEVLPKLASLRDVSHPSHQLFLWWIAHLDGVFPPQGNISLWPFDLRGVGKLSSTEMAAYTVMQFLHTMHVDEDIVQLEGHEDISDSKKHWCTAQANHQYGYFSTVNNLQVFNFESWFICSPMHFHIMAITNYRIFFPLSMNPAACFIMWMSQCPCPCLVWWFHMTNPGLTFRTFAVCQR